MDRCCFRLPSSTCGPRSCCLLSFFHTKGSRSGNITPTEQQNNIARRDTQLQQLQIQTVRIVKPGLVTSAQHEHQHQHQHHTNIAIGANTNANHNDTTMPIDIRLVEQIPPPPAPPRPPTFLTPSQPTSSASPSSSPARPSPPPPASTSASVSTSTRPAAPSCSGTRSCTRRTCSGPAPGPGTTGAAGPCRGRGRRLCLGRGACGSRRGRWGLWRGWMWSGGS